VLRLLSALALLGLGAGTALALAAQPVPQDKTDALQRLGYVATTDSNTVPAPAPDSEPQPIPGEMLGSDVPVPIPPSVLRARNGWLVSDGRRLVAVYAGATGRDSSVGCVVIVRQNLVSGRQTVRTIETGPTGALTIAVAPLGSSVETSAQTASIVLRTAGRRTLRLDLGTDTIDDTATVPPPRPARSSDSASHPLRR
jgi:hypothetical protein